MTSILFAALSRETVVLCDTKVVAGNFEYLCQSMLDYLQSNMWSKEKYSYETAEHSVYVYISGGLCYMCVTTPVFDRNVAFNCLFELERQLIFAKLKDRAMVASPYSLRTSFSPIMKSTLSRSTSTDVLCRLEDRVGEVTDILHDNINKVMERGDQLNDLESRSEMLNNTAINFKNNAIKLRRKLWWKSSKMWLILLAVFLAGIVIIIVVALSFEGVFDKK